MECGICSIFETARLSIRGSRAEFVLFILFKYRGPSGLSRLSTNGGYDEKTRLGVGRARLFTSLDVFPQLARSISHTQITHVPTPPECPGNLCLQAGMPSLSSSIVLAPRVRSQFCFFRRTNCSLSRDQTISMIILPVVINLRSVISVRSI